MDTADNLGYSTENARSAGQAQVMKDAAKVKKCIFCDIDFSINKPLNKKGEFDPEGKDWPLLWVWENPFPQEYHKHHLMIIPRRHINNEEWYLITNEEWLQILDAWKWAQTFYNLPGGGFVGRFGERSRNAGTIGHLHFQLQIPDGTGNAKATFFKDRSPAEEAKRANRKAYANNDLKEIKGFTVRNIHGEFLSKDFHWIMKPFVHVEKSLSYIFDALYNWNIPNLEEVTIQPATYTRATKQATLSDSIKTALWGFLAYISNRAAYKQDLVRGYIFQNAEGLFLSSNFSWEKKNSPEGAFVHTEENFRRILAGFQHKNPWKIYDAQIYSDDKTATITGVLLDNRPN